MPSKFTPRSAFKPGCTPWNKGVGGVQPWMNLSGLKKYTEWRRGKPGRLLSKEIREKISAAHKGRPGTNMGKKFGAEVRAKISASLRGKRGPLSRNWKGGRKSLALIIRHCELYKQWRTAVFTRDGYKCVVCSDSTSGSLEADHHPKMFSVILHEHSIRSYEDAAGCSILWDVSSGRTLCKSCHRHVTSTQRRRSH